MYTVKAHRRSKCSIWHIEQWLCITLLSANDWMRYTTLTAFSAGSKVTVWNLEGWRYSLYYQLQQQQCPLLSLAAMLTTVV